MNVKSLDESLGLLYEKHGMSITYKGGFKSYSKPCILNCSVHGDFVCEISRVVSGDRYCSKCKSHRNAKSRVGRKLLYGVGVSDLDGRMFSSRKRWEKVYNVWVNMLERCYSSEYQKMKPTYVGCLVEDNWRSCQKFYEDIRGLKNYEMLHEGWHLDKDILFEGNKIYSKKTTCIVPMEVNMLFTGVKKHEITGRYGVGLNQSRTLKFITRISVKGNPKTLGTFSDIDEAEMVYKKHKLSTVLDVFSKYKDLLDDSILNGLTNREIFNGVDLNGRK